MRFPGMKQFPSTSLQERTCMIVLMQMYYHSCISQYHAAMLVPHMYAHAACSFGYVTVGSCLAHAKAKWVFFRSAIIPSECRQTKLLGWHPRTPISHSQHTSSQREIRQNHLDRSGTNTSKPFVCHTWGPQMDSHHIVDWKFMLIYTSSPFLFPNITFILPAIKCFSTCPYCPPTTNLSVSIWRQGRKAMFPCHLSHVHSDTVFGIAHALLAYFITSLCHSWSNE